MYKGMYASFIWGNQLSKYEIQSSWKGSRYASKHLGQSIYQPILS